MEESLKEILEKNQATSGEISKRSTGVFYKGKLLKEHLERLEQFLKEFRNNLLGKHWKDFLMNP